MCRIQTNEGETESEALERHTIRAQKELRDAIDKLRSTQKGTKEYHKASLMLSRAMKPLYSTGPDFGLAEILKEYHESK